MVRKPFGVFTVIWNSKKERKKYRQTNRQAETDNDTDRVKQTDR